MRHWRPGHDLNSPTPLGLGMRYLVARLLRRFGFALRISLDGFATQLGVGGLQPPASHYAGNLYQVLGDVVGRLEHAGATKRTCRAVHDDCAVPI